jgi:LmbE family N-acetylglucosaminyl deacetylase
MATLASFHAHPDDESITCGGALRKASEAGHRVVLVLATRGDGRGPGITETDLLAGL